LRLYLTQTHNYTGNKTNPLYGRVSIQFPFYENKLHVGFSPPKKNIWKLQSYWI